MQRKWLSHQSICVIRHTPADVVFHCVHPPAPVPLVTPRNLAPAFKTSFRPLSLRCCCSCLSNQSPFAARESKPAKELHCKVFQSRCLARLAKRLGQRRNLRNHGRKYSQFGNYVVFDCSRYTFGLKSVISRKRRLKFESVS